MAKITHKASLDKLLRAWRKKFFDVTFEFMASSAQERSRIVEQISKLARRYRLKRIGSATLCVDKSPVIQLLTYHCGQTPKHLAGRIMDGISHISQGHPSVEWHFKFVTKI